MVDLNWLITAAAVLVLLRLRHYVPVAGLTYISCQEMQALRNGIHSIKAVDIRDSSLYLQGHLPESVNIFVGRLPYVWHQELTPEDHIVLIGERRYALQRAARILRRQAGITSIQAWVVPKEMPVWHWANDECTCLEKV